MKKNIKNIAGLAGLFLLTFSLLALEITFTRIYSFLFNHNYVYFIISLGIAGIGFGCYLYYKFESQIKKIFYMFIIAPFVSIFLLFLFNYLFVNIITSFIFTAVIFIILGVIISHIYKESKIKLQIIYFIDLLGASIGSISTYFIMQTVGIPKTIQILFSLLMFSIWIIIITTIKIKKIYSFIIFILILIFSVNILFKIDFLFKLPGKDNKEINFFLNENKPVIDSEWKAFGKIDLVETDDPDKKIMFIDGGAGSNMVKYKNFKNEYEKSAEILKNIPALTLALTSIEASMNDSVLVIGSGGGIEVTSFLYTGIKKITSVEINPGFINLVKKHGDFNGNIYNNHPNVELIQADGRKYVRNTDKKFNIITISMPLIKSMRNYQNYAMAENYLFTSNAFSDYNKALKDNGYLLIVAHNRLEILRLLMNVLDSFKKEKITSMNAMKQIAIIEVGHTPIIIIKKNPFKIDEANRLHRALHSVPNQQEGVNYIPFIKQVSHEMMDEYNNVIEHYMFNNYFYRLSIGEIDIKEIYDTSSVNIKPVNDNKPFFYYFENGVNISVIVPLLFSVIILMFFFFNKNKDKKNSLKFIIIGIGFIMIEIGLLQSYGYFWGQDTFSLSLVLSLILFSAGTGSLISKFIRKIKISLNVFSLIIPFLIILILILNIFILRYFDNSVFIIKLMITIITIFPQFFILGVIFPKLLERVENKNIPKMLAINSISTVIGTIVSLIIAVTFGFIQVTVIGGLLYIFLLRIKHVN